MSTTHGRRIVALASALATTVTVLPSIANAEGAEAQREIVLVKDGTSPYSILVASGAPSSVRLGAEELQRVLQLATGVKLPVSNEVRSPLISLGDNAASRQAGLSSAELPDEGFRILTRGNNVYILGNDWPDDEKKWARCDSTGTLFGVYDFLERTVSVRWLMPGPWGEDIPHHPEGLRVPHLDVRDAPIVPHRVFNCSPRNHPDVRAWLRRSRVGRSIAPSWGHNFSSHPSTEALEAHPEYMPLLADGRRETPVGNRAWGQHEHKLCVSNPELIQAFAWSLMQELAKHPHRQGASMAPADGGRWCTCPACAALTLTDKTGHWQDFPPYGRSRTPLVLQFYNGVARRMAARYPDRLVGGLLYHDYLYPPYEPTKAEPNVFCAVAINSGYGFKFYKPETAARVSRVLADWADIVQNLGWTDYSTWMRNPIGAPLPPGLPILKTVFGSFGTSLKVINYQSQGAWGYGAAHNYVVARLLWNPRADIDALYRECLTRAYGPAAAPIDRLYSLVEESLRDFTIAKPYPDHEIWYETAVKVYAPIFDQIERLYFEAAEAAETEAQKKRLQMFESNLVICHWNLRRAGLLENPERSPLYRDDEAFETFLATLKGSPAVVDLDWYGTYRWQTALWVPEKRSLDIPRLPEGAAPPRLDGRLDDTAWKTAGLADQFRMNEKRRGPARWQTTVRVVYDSKQLYVAFQAEENEPGKIRKACTAPDSDSVLKDDVVEMHVRLPGGANFEIAVNAGGVVRKRGRVSPHAAAAVAAPGWIVELAVPFSSLGVDTPANGVKWRGNFARRRVGPPIQRSTWCRTEERLSDGRAFGEWRFLP